MGTVRRLHSAVATMSFVSALGIVLATEALAAAPTPLPEDNIVSEEAQAEPVESTSPSEPDETASAWEKRPFALELHLGVAAPTGALGGVLDYSLLPWLSLGCGVGTNFVGAAGECRLRLRWIRRRNKSLYFGAGLSGGPHRQTPLSRAGIFAIPLAPMSAMGHGPPPASRDWDFAKWANFELGFEHRGLTGGVIRPYVGIAVLLNPEDSTIDATQEEIDASDYAGPVGVAEALIYAGIGFGRAF